MLQALREKTSGWIAFLILASVGVPFAFFGINNYFETQTESFVARVGKQEISPQEFRERVEQLRAQTRREQGPGFDGSQFNDPMVKRQVLDRLIDEELLMKAARGAGAGATDASVRRQIAAVPAFQVEGKFSPDQYRLLLQAQGMSAPGFENTVRRDLEVRALPSAVAATTPVSDSEIEAYVKLRDQVRDFRYFFVSTPPEIATAAIGDDELEKYYAAHQDAYMTPEQVSLDYIELDAANLEAPADADEATLKARYEEQKARYTVKEQRLASHILVAVEKKAAADAQKQAQEKAAALAAEARAGKDFAELAKASSDDLGSKNQGGDLGWIEQGMMQGAFDEALFKLEPNKVSDPVLTDEGFHVILVREVKPGSQRSFEEVRAELLKEYQDTERESRYNDIAGRLNDLVFQNQGSLDPVAEALNLKIQHTAMFGRQGGQGIAADPNVLKKAFSDAVLVDGNVSDPIDVGPNRQVVIRVAEHKPKTARALSEVKEQVLARLRSEKIAAGAKERADALRKRIAEGADFDKLMQEAGATATSAKAVGRRAVNQDPALVQEAFKLPRPAEGKPSLAVVSLPRDRYGVIEVGAAQDGDITKLDDAQRKAVREELARNMGASEVRSMIDVLRARTQVKVVEDRL